MPLIRVMNATKDYGQNRGIFELNLNIDEGEVFGLLGPNGAGKTTTIRHLLGFSKLDAGKMEITGFDAWNESAKIQAVIGYLPGEIAFPDQQTGMEFIAYIGRLRGMKSLEKAERLLAYFDVDPRAKLKRMSKGMKQKIALVVAFMHDPKIVILDEPTSGLDPLMQEKFIQLIAQEKHEGKTILLSSHMFHEIERTCDRVAIIKQGRLLTEIAMKEIRRHREKVYEIGFGSSDAFDRFMAFNLPATVGNQAKSEAAITIDDADINVLLEKLAKVDVAYFKEDVYTLEKHFMQFYGKGE